MRTLLQRRCIFPFAITLFLSTSCSNHDSFSKKDAALKKQTHQAVQVKPSKKKCLENPNLDPTYADFCQRDVLAAKLYKVGGFESRLHEAVFEDGETQLVYMAYDITPSPSLHFITTVGRAPLTLIIDKNSWQSVEALPYFRDKNNTYCFRQRHTGPGNLWILKEVNADTLVSVKDYKSSDPDFDRELQERRREFPDLVATDGTLLIDLFCNVLTFEDFLTRSEKYQRR